MNGIFPPQSEVAREINDLSYLNPDHFRITFDRIRDSVFWAQEVTPPGIRLGTTDTKAGTGTVKLPSTMIENGDLEISFVVDEYISSWKAIYMWLYEMRDPESMGSAPDDHREEKSQCEIQLLDNSYHPIAQFVFSGVTPIELGGLPLRTNQRENETPTFVASFAFDSMALTTRDELPEDIALDRE